MPGFSRTLVPLKTSVQRLCEHHLPVRATFWEPAAVDFQTQLPKPVVTSLMLLRA